MYAGPTVGQPNGQRLARKVIKLEKLKVSFPHRAEEFDAEITKINETLASLFFCRRCGRPLKTDKAKQEGYGPECYRKSLLEFADMHSQERTP